MLSYAVPLVIVSIAVVTAATNPTMSEEMVTPFFLTKSQAKPKFQKKDEPHVCSVYIYTDPFLWRQMYKLQDGSSKATYNRILKMIQRSVKEANRVYNMAEFYGKGRTIHKGIKFELTDYYIDTDLNCNPPPEKHGQAKWKFEKMDCIEPDVPMVDICSYKPDCLFKNNIFCNKFKSMRFFLHAFSAMRHDQHCLAFAFTYRETSDFQGIAWIKGHNPEDLRTMHHFGYCAKDDAEHCQIMRDHRRDSKYAKMGTWPQHYFRNTGVVNLHLVQGLLSEKSAVHIFIHELGHSLGAKHDNESTECTNLTDETFLMTGDAKKIILGQTSEHFSVCSSRKIGLNLDQSTCWADRHGTEKSCQSEDSLESNRNCLEHVANEIETSQATLVFLETSIFTGLLTIMLILGLSTCVLCCYKRCKSRLSQNETAAMTAGASNAQSGITSSLMVNQPMPRVIRSAPNACQFHPRAYYTQMAKNATTKDAQPV